MFCFKQTFRTLAAAALCLAPAAFGQRWEVGAGGGASIYNTRSISSPSGAVDARFKPGYGFSAYLGQIGDRVGGEIRYTWLSNEMELTGSGRSFSMGGRSQSISYAILFYLARKNAKTRPYFLAGGGTRQYTGTGSASALQPLINVAVLTNTSEWKPVVTTGAGVRVAAGNKAHVRAELLLYLSEAPTKVITPVTGSLSGWYVNFVPMVSLSYVW